MRNRFFLFAPAIMLFAFAPVSKAQSVGQDAASVKWNTVSTGNFKIIYPLSADSLARVYANTLEAVRIPVSHSLGLIPNRYYSSPMPVVLRGYNAVSNGFVTWLPRRMELFINPMMQPFTYMPWEWTLSVHESRHIAQMQLGRYGFFRWFRIFGDYPAALLTGMFPNTALLEGDAVVLETALSEGGRGRNADFLSYYRMAFDNGDFRNWYRWRYGSLRRYTPDHYALGYMTVGGIRTLYDDPYYMKSYMLRFANVFRIFNLQRTVYKNYGVKFKHAWKDIMYSFDKEWEKEDTMRPSFMPEKRIVEEPAYFTRYSGGSLISGEEGVVAVKAGLDKSAALVKVLPDGTESVLRPFSPDASRPAYDPVYKRIYWSEPVPHPRWGMKMSSRIKYLELKYPETVNTLARKGRLYNPSVSPDGKSLAAIEIGADGKSSIVVLGTADGKVKTSFKAEDGLQFYETAWTEGGLYIVALSGNGNGIYHMPLGAEKPSAGDRSAASAAPEREIPAGHPEDSSVCTSPGSGPACILLPSHVKIANLRHDGAGKLLFESDLSGISEIYSFDPAGGILVQKTSTPYGTGEAFAGEDGGLYHSSLTPQGNLLFYTAKDELIEKVADFSDVHSYPVADKLSRQEALIAVPPQPDTSVSALSAPRRYRKLGHAINFHSWIPFYSESDPISEINKDFYYKSASFGAMGMFGNKTGTVSGSIGLSIHDDPNPDNARTVTIKQADGTNQNLTVAAQRVGYHLNLVYSGLLPIFELFMDYNDRQSTLSGARFKNEGGNYVVQTVEEWNTSRLINTRFRTYIPLNLSSGGWERGLLPYFQMQWSNDRIEVPGKDNPLVRHISPSAAMNFSLSGHSTRQVPPSRTFPAYGAGFKLDYRIPVYNEGYNVLSARLFAYLPGFGRLHGFKFSANMRKGYSPDFISTGEGSIAPRGFENSGVPAMLNSVFGLQGGLSVDYSLPFWSLDRNFIGPLTYIRNFELVPFADFTVVGGIGSILTLPIGDGANLYSAGADFIVKFGKFLMLENVSLGARVSCNGGSAFDFCREQTGCKSVTAKVITSISF